MELPDAAEGFAALAQAKRLDLMRLLASTGATGMSAGDLAAQLGSPASSLSFHLSALERTASCNRPARAGTSSTPYVSPGYAACSAS
jgi:DNA-binding transcriptional ArsR family regulator